jgi:hypothetical protein
VEPVDEKTIGLIETTHPPAVPYPQLLKYRHIPIFFWIFCCILPVRAMAGCERACYQINSVQRALGGWIKACQWSINPIWVKKYISLPNNWQNSWL